MLQLHLKVQGVFFSIFYIYFLYRTLIFFLVFPHIQRWEAGMKREKKTAIVAAFHKFIMSWRKQAIDAIYCALFSVVVFMYIFFVCFYSQAPF